MEENGAFQDSVSRLALVAGANTVVPWTRWIQPIHFINAKKGEYKEGKRRRCNNTPTDQEISSFRRSPDRGFVKDD